MVHFLLVAMGGALGASFRHLANIGALRLFGPAFPWGTLIVNVVGSLLMGAFIGWLARRSGGSSNELRLFVATGFLGGFTTFSAFSLDFATLWRDGTLVTAFAYASASVLGSLFALFVGLWILRFAS